MHKMNTQNVNDSCLSDPNFAVICSFLQTYAKYLHIFNPSFKELQSIIESNDVSNDLVDAIIQLLRQCKIKFVARYWEPALSKFCLTYSNDDAHQITTLGFKNITTTMKLRVLKELFEYQFECNASFKLDVNRLTAGEQRNPPMMHDKGGNVIWALVDSNTDVAVYKENYKEKSWISLAHDSRELWHSLNVPLGRFRKTKLISQLNKFQVTFKNGQ